MNKEFPKKNKSIPKSVDQLHKMYTRNEIDLQPWFQRNKIWPDVARFGLIDTIFRNLPIPEIVVRVKRTKTGKFEKYEVIDGQQRLSAIFDFIDNRGLVKNSKFDLKQAPNSAIRIHESLLMDSKKSKKKKGISYSDLESTDEDRFDSYQILVREVEETDKSKVEDLFRRLNTNVFENNRQELRNATYEGDMKDLARELTKSFQDFLLINKIVTQKNCWRQLDTDKVINEMLLVATMTGIVPSSNDVKDDLYSTNDDMGGMKAKIKKDLEDTQYFLESLFKTDSDGRSFVGTVFSKHAHGYLPLFTTIYLMITGNWTDETGNRVKHRIYGANKSALTRRLEDFGENTHLALKSEPKHNKKDANLINQYKKHVHYGRTTNLTPRVKKCKIIYQLLSKYMPMMELKTKCLPSDRTWLWNEWKRKTGQDVGKIDQVMCQAKTCIHPNGRLIKSFAEMDCGHIKMQKMGYGRGGKERKNLRPEHFGCNRSANKVR